MFYSVPALEATASDGASNAVTRLHPVAIFAGRRRCAELLVRSAAHPLTRSAPEFQDRRHRPL